MIKLMFHKFILYFLFITLYLFSASPALAATLSLSPASGTFNQGCTFSVQVLVDTGGAETDGTDVILLYDPDKLKATSIVNGSIYRDYPNNAIDLQKGKVSIFGLTSAAKTFSGTGTVATVNFVMNTTALGATDINFDFDTSNPTKTSDSNVIEHTALTDVLKSVTNGQYIATAGGGTCNSSGAETLTSATSTPIPANVYQGSTLPNSGTTSITLVGLSVSFGLIAVGVLGFHKRKNL